LSPYVLDVLETGQATFQEIHKLLQNKGINVGVTTVQRVGPHLCGSRARESGRQGPEDGHDFLDSKYLFKMKPIRRIL
jgi:hypothetical protein